MVFRFDQRGDRLVFADTRTLGTLCIMHENELHLIHGLSSMGPEPLTPQFTTEYLATVLSRRKGK